MTPGVASCPSTFIASRLVATAITAPVALTIVPALVNSGQAVEFGQPLYLVKPD